MNAETLHNPISRPRMSNPVSRLFRYYWGESVAERVRIFFCLQLALIFTGVLVWFGNRTLLVIYAYLGCYVLGLFVLMYKDRGFWRRIKSVHLFALFLTIYHVWGFLVLDDKTPVIYETVRSYIRSLLTVYTVAATLSGKKELRIFANFMQLGLILNALVSLMGYRYPFIYKLIVFDKQALADSENAGRFAGLYPNPNGAGYAFVTLMFISAWANNRLAVVSRCFGIVAIYLTFSRTSQYMMIFYVILSSSRRILLQWQAGDYKRVATTIAKMAAGVGVVATLVFLNLETLQNDPKFQRFQNISDKRRGYSGRFGVLSDSLQAIGRNSWYGRGLFQFQTGISQIRPGVYVGAHNTYVMLWGEGGLWILFMYIAALAYATRRGWRMMANPDNRFYISLYLGYVWVVGATWHHLLSQLHGVMMVIFVYHLPSLFRAPKPKIQALPPPPAENALATD